MDGLRTRVGGWSLTREVSRFVRDCLLSAVLGRRINPFGRCAAQDDEHWPKWNLSDCALQCARRNGDAVKTTELTIFG